MRGRKVVVWVVWWGGVVGWWLGGGCGEVWGRWGVGGGGFAGVFSSFRNGFCLCLCRFY